ncbi:sugar transferase [Flagellimonas okinawensis]|uniref:Sugar transferase n=1 Tax=Flagellimonas okinawensis TaxID=3031324 RepID=A0ABT5XR23_9FLAO|nr:sugar transferase [[Muricauda] okinawensis]MDF0708328.1 sugar transferase [[Muricauda] okinawensis]
MNWYKNYFKRAIDFIASLFGLLILSPIVLIVAILLGIDFKGNPFFKQNRPGKNERIFGIVKFKTMNDKKDEQGNLLPDNERITPLGKFIRKTSLDEIPQLINVLKGDMSLVGPRPLRTFYLPYYNQTEKIRHHVRPGITGLAQVSGRNFLTWEEKFAYDITYVQNLSFPLDVKILFKTFKKAFFDKDVADDPNAYVENFDIYRTKQRQQKNEEENIDAKEYIETNTINQ